MRILPPKKHIYTKILAGFTAIFMVSVISGMVTIRNGGNTSERVNVLTERTTPVLMASLKIELLLTQIAGEFQQLLNQHTHEDISIVEQSIKESQSELEEHLEQAKMLVEPLEQSSVAKENIERFATLYNEMEALIVATSTLHINSIDQRQSFENLILQLDDVEKSFTPEFESLLFTLDDDYSLAVANEFYASFLRGVMTVKDIALSQDISSLNDLANNFPLWEQSHQTQFFSFVSLAMSYPDSRDFMQQAGNYTDVLLLISNGSEDSPGLIPLRRQILELQQAYQDNLSTFFDQQRAVLARIFHQTEPGDSDADHIIGYAA